MLTTTSYLSENKEIFRGLLLTTAHPWPLEQYNIAERPNQHNFYVESNLEINSDPFFQWETARDEIFFIGIEIFALNPLLDRTELKATTHGKKATVAGAVITRQRPGTAKGLIFLTLEDETGNANVIVMPDIYEKYRQAVLEPRFIRVSGMVQNQDGIVHLRAEHVEALAVSAAQMSSHDFH